MKKIIVLVLLLTGITLYAQNEQEPKQLTSLRDRYDDAVKSAVAHVTKGYIVELEDLHEVFLQKKDSISAAMVRREIEKYEAELSPDVTKKRYKFQNGSDTKVRDWYIAVSDGKVVLTKEDDTAFWILEESGTKDKNKVYIRNTSVKNRGYLSVNTKGEIVLGDKNRNTALWLLVPDGRIHNLQFVGTVSGKDFWLDIDVGHARLELCPKRGYIGQRWGMIFIEPK